MKFLSYGVMVYMLMALIWWTILLSRNNNVIYQKNKTIITHEFEGSDQNTDTEKAYNFAKKEYLRNKYMILGEGMVFGLSLIIGIWFIQKAFSKEMENNARQKNFLLSITHELKSPIAAINLITETLIKRKLDNDQIKDLHESILSESTRLEKLINNLLLATRLNQQYHYNFEQCNLSELMLNTIKKSNLQFPDASISFIENNKSVHIEADKEALTSVFTNLIENAVKYSQSPAKIDILVAKTGKTINISVKDQGIGIPDAEKIKVTQQFYRVGNEEIRQTKGTGLGLYISEKIISAHGGRLHITDNIPAGSVFTISFPIK